MQTQGKWRFIFFFYEKQGSHRIFEIVRTSVELEKFLFPHQMKNNSKNNLNTIFSKQTSKVSNFIFYGIILYNSTQQIMKKFLSFEKQSTILALLWCADRICF
jgi:hypothetical protein